MMRWRARILPRHDVHQASGKVKDAHIRLSVTSWKSLGTTTLRVRGTSRIGRLG